MLSMGREDIHLDRDNRTKTSYLMNIELIKGKFEKNEAIDLITRMIHVKIAFHEKKIESSSTEEDVEMREKRIRQLQEDLYNARNFLKTQGDMISLNSTINMNMGEQINADNGGEPGDSFQLVRGVFSPDDASRVLFDLVKSKIRYHHDEAFRIEEKYNGDVSHSKQRIKELKALNEQLEKTISDARSNSKRLKVDGKLNISFQE